MKTIHQKTEPYNETSFCDIRSKKEEEVSRKVKEFGRDAMAGARSGIIFFLKKVGA